MPGLKIMMIDSGTDQEIRCRFVSEWYKIDTLVSGKRGLLSEIKKNKPDVVLMDMNLYAKIDGIETTQKIVRSLIFLFCINDDCEPQSLPHMRCPGCLM
jgi:CheY-like chemotaxis protein